MKISGDNFLRRLEQGLLPRILLFQGEEEYWVAQGLAEMRKKLFPEGQEEFNSVDLEAGSLEEGTLNAALSTPPFLAPHRLVILRGLEGIKTKVDLELVAALDRLPEGLYLLITAKKPDQRRKVFKEVHKRGTVVECRPFKVYEAKKWLVAEGKKMGLAVSPAVSDLLLERRGVSLSMLHSELEKALIYQGGERELSLEEWMDLIGGAAEGNIFALIDHTSEGDLRGALGVLDRLLRDGEPEMKILFMLGRQIRQLFQAWFFLQEGRGKEALQHELKCHPFVAEKLVNQARPLSFLQLRSTLHRILQADYRIKSGVNEPQLELEMTVLDLTSILAA